MNCALCVNWSDMCTDERVGLICKCTVALEHSGESICQSVAAVVTIQCSLGQTSTMLKSISGQDRNRGLARVVLIS